MVDYSTDLEFHYDFLELLARRLRPKLYVGLGIASGKCIERIARYCQRAVGVDLVSPESINGYEFVALSTVEFLTQILPSMGAVDLAFIDADHRFEASFHDFELLLPHMAQDGLILLHDTYPESGAWLGNHLCGDTYRTAIEIRRRASDFGVEIVTLPTPPGLSIVRRCDRHLAWSPSDGPAAP